MVLKPSAGRGAIFSQRWVDALKGVPEAAMSATIRIYAPGTGEAVYDPVENVYVPVETTLVECKARVQPVRAASSRQNLADDTTVQNVLVQIPIDEADGIDFRPEHRAVVLTAPLNTALTKYLFVVQEVMDSSNPFERTLMFTVNQEAVV